MERNLWAEPGDLTRCIFRSRRRVGWCEFSERLFSRPPIWCFRVRPISRKAAPYDFNRSVTMASGRKPCLLSNFLKSFRAARLLRRFWTRTFRASLMRTLALPKDVEHWSLTTLREKLIKIGAKVVHHGRYTTFQLAEVAIPQTLFAEILGLIDGLRPAPLPR